MKDTSLMSRASGERLFRHYVARALTILSSTAYGRGYGLTPLTRLGMQFFTPSGPLWTMTRKDNFDDATVRVDLHHRSFRRSPSSLSILMAFLGRTPLILVSSFGEVDASRISRSSSSS